MDEARAYGIPIICVVDADKQLVREVIDCYMEKGLGWLFDAQIISHTVQSRDHAIDLMISAIRRAIHHCHAHDTLTAVPTKGKETTSKDDQKKADVHEIDAADTDGLVSQLKEAVVANYGSARAAFDAHSKDGGVSKKEWKKLIKKVLPSLKQADGKYLRKRLKNRLSSAEFCSFIEGLKDKASNIDKAKADSKEDEIAGLASLPPEVPEVCRWWLWCLFFVCVDGCLFVCSYLPALGLDCMPRSSCLVHCSQGKVPGRPQ